MRTRREWGAAIFSDGRPLTRTGNGTNKAASIERGTLVGDSWTNSDGSERANILIDGNSQDDAGEFGVDVPMGSGSRVIVFKRKSQSIVLPITAAVIAEAKRVTLLEASDQFQTIDGMGEYATTADLSATSQDLTAVFTAGLSEKGKTYIGAPSPPYYEGDVYIDSDAGLAYTCVNSREIGSFVQSDWQVADAFLSSIIRQDTNGVTVGRADSTYQARVSSDASFDILERGSPLLEIFYDGKYDRAVIQSRTNTDVAISTSNEMMFSFRQGGAMLSSSSGGLLLSTSTGSSFVEQSSYIYANAVGTCMLFENSSGTGGTVTLSQSASRYAMITIVYKDAGDRLHSMDVYKPNGKSVGLFSAAINASSLNGNVSGSAKVISGTSITNNTAYMGGMNIGNDSTSVFANTSIYIVAVIGWRR